MNDFIITTLLIVLLGITGCSSDRTANEQFNLYTGVDVRNIQSSNGRQWQEFINSRLTLGTNVKITEVLNEMQAYSQAWGRWATGGSGDQCFTFIIDDDYEARVSCDVNDIVQTAGIFNRDKTLDKLWVNHSDHIYRYVEPGNSSEETE